MMDEATLAGKLATIAATQEHTASALESLTAEVRASRADLGKISTEIATTKIRLSNHVRSNDQRIDTLSGAS